MSTNSHVPFFEAVEDVLVEHEAEGNVKLPTEFIVYLDANTLEALKSNLVLNQTKKPPPKEQEEFFLDILDKRILFRLDGLEKREQYAD